MSISNSLDSKRFRRTFAVVIFLTILAVPPCHAQDSKTELGVFWKLPFLPFSIHLGPGGVKVQGETSIVTPIGEFGIDASVPVVESPKPTVINNVPVEKDDLLLVVRNTRQWGDKIYKIAGGKEISVFTDGFTMISATNGNVIVDVSNETVREINFAGKTEIPGNASEQRASNQTIPVELKLWYQDRTEKIFKPLPKDGTLHIGDLYKIVFRTPEDAYVYVFNTDDAGKSLRLFPIKDFKGVAVNHANPVKGGQSRYIPSAEMSFRLDAQTGTGKIWYAAMKQPDSRLEHADFEQGGADPVLKYLYSICRDRIREIS